MKWTEHTDTLHTGEGKRGKYTLEFHSFAWTASSPDSDDMIGFGTLKRCKQAADRHNEEEPADIQAASDLRATLAAKIAEAEDIIAVLRRTTRKMKVLEGVIAAVCVFSSVALVLALHL